MTICVLAGSPKGESSVTMQYVRWLEAHFPGHQWDVRQIASRIRKIEDKPGVFAEILDAVRGADAVLWAFPLYVMTVHAAYKRFIELVFERGAAGAFAGKYAASLSTSIHFYDHTAHNYIREVSEDLGMGFIAAHSPKMYDLAAAAGCRQLAAFGDEFLALAAERPELARRSIALAGYRPASPAPWTGPKAATSRRVTVVTDDADGPAGRMARAFAAMVDGPVDLLDLKAADIKGDCLGCLKCGPANRCVWEGTDGYSEMFRSRLLGAELLVFAVTARDRLFSAAWKRFFDRAFFNTHQRTLIGKQFAFLVAGPLSQMANLRQVLEALTEWQGANLVEMLSDEAADDSELTRRLAVLARRSLAAAETGVVRPNTFLGVGGIKIFRDDIYDELRMVFKADHRNYRRTGVYDFPQNNPVKRLVIWLAYWVTSIPPIQQGMLKGMKTGILGTLPRVVEKERAGRLALRGDSVS